MLLIKLGPEVNALKRDSWKRDVSKRDNLKHPVCNVWSIKGQIKLLFYIVQSYNFVMEEFNLTYEVQKLSHLEMSRFQLSCLRAVASGLVPLIQLFSKRLSWYFALKTNSEVWKYQIIDNSTSNRFTKYQKIQWVHMFNGM